MRDVDRLGSRNILNLIEVCELSIYSRARQGEVCVRPMLEEPFNELLAERFAEFRESDLVVLSRKKFLRRMYRIAV